MHSRYIRVYVILGFLLWLLAGLLMSRIDEGMGFGFVSAFGLTGALLALLSLCSLELLSRLPDIFDETTPRWFAIISTRLFIAPAMGILASYLIFRTFGHIPGGYRPFSLQFLGFCVIFGFLSFATFEIPRTITLTMSPYNPKRRRQNNQH